MALVVQKYGGTSVGTPERIQKVAERIAKTVQNGDQVVVVVSAMGDATNDLMRLARTITDQPNRREVDMLLSAGERMSMALLSMALHARDIPAISFTGSQSGIITDTAHTRARIQDIRPIRIGPELEKGRVVIVAGFQGVSPEKEVTTLGRGGSDTSAVALASALRASRCEIYTDVRGVLSADPRLVENPVLVTELSWRDMAEAAHCGAGVVHHRAASLAARIRVPYTVRSAFEDSQGTWVGDPATPPGVRLAAGVPEITVATLTCPDSVFERLCQEMERFDLRSYKSQTTGSYHFLIPDEDSEALGGLQQSARAQDQEPSFDRGWASVSVVGHFEETESAGQKAQARLKDTGVPVLHSDTAPSRITLLVGADTFRTSMRTLHQAFVN